MSIHEGETDVALSFANLEITEVIAGKRELRNCPGIKKLAEIGYGDYEQKAKDALKAVSPGIGFGEDPLEFVIACFVSQAARIKELTLDLKEGNCRFHCRDKSLRAKSKSQLKRLSAQIYDIGRMVTYGPIREEDGSRLVYWDDECRGRLMPEFDI